MKKRTASEDRDTKQLIDSFRKAAETDDFWQRKAVMPRIREAMSGNHWGDSDRVDPVTNPSAGYTWLAVERMHPRIFAGYRFDPEVVPETSANYALEMDSPLRQVLGQVPGEHDDTDAVKEARIQSAVIAQAWERVDGLAIIKDALKAAIYYGEAWLVDGWADDEPTLDIVKQENVRKDPAAKCVKDSRFLAYYVDRRLLDLKNEYPEHAKDLRATMPKDGREGDSNRRHDGISGDASNVRLECWFIRDKSTKTVIERTDIEVEELQERQDAGWSVVEEHQTMREPTPADDVMAGLLNGGIPVTVGYTIERSKEVPKYRGGWRMVKIASDVILYDGESYSASGDLPMHWVPCFKVPGELSANGVPDQVQDINKLIDIMLAEGVRYVRTAKPFIIAREGTLSEGGVENLSIPGTPPVQTAAPDDPAPLSNMVLPVSFPELSAGYQNLLNRLIEILQEVTGSYDLRGENVAFDKSSGVAIEAVESSANQRMAELQQTAKNVARSVCRNLLANTLRYHNGHFHCELKHGNVSAAVDIEPELLDSDDFERKFDIVIGSAVNLPPTGKARNELIIESVGQLASMGPALAVSLVDIMEVPEKAAIKAALSAHFAELKSQQQAQGADGKPDTSQADIQKRYSESLSDSLEDLAKRKDVPPLVSLRIMQYLQAGAEGGKVPPLEQLVSEITGVSAPQPAPTTGPPAIQAVQGA